MSPRKPARKSVRKIAAGLAGLSLLLLILPPRLTNGFIGLMQWLVPLQHASSVVVDTAANALSSEKTVVPHEEFVAAERLAEAYEHQAIALGAKVEELEQEVQVLTAARLWDAAGSRLGSRGRLIPARVLSQDVVPWRSSRLTSAGSLQGVPSGAAVVTKVFTVAHGDDGGVRDGLGILLGEAYVGLVEKVTTHTSRVKLLSDPSVQMKVRIGRFEPGGFVLVPGFFWLVGRGEGRMEIRDVEARSLESGAVQVGDVVLSDPRSENLPAGLKIGNVSQALTDRENPLFVHLAVTPALAETDLDRVYIYDPENEPTP